MARSTDPGPRDVRVEMATSGGHPGRANEDFVGAVPGLAVVVDGAGIPGTESLCRHGVAWYAHTLGATLLARASTRSDLVDLLAVAIDEVAGRHRHTCDLTNASSPQATIAMVRLGVEEVQWLVLADAYVVLDPTASAPVVLTDPREVDVRAECSLPLAGLAPGTPEYDAALPAVIDQLRARRNAVGGYWIAKDDPAAASEAVTGNVPLASLRGLALLSNGASRVVDPYDLCDWPAVTELLREAGPDEVIARVRAAEADGRGSDDATAAYVHVDG